MRWTIRNLLASCSGQHAFTAQWKSQCRYSNITAYLLFLPFHSASIPAVRSRSEVTVNKMCVSSSGFQFIFFSTFSSGLVNKEVYWIEGGLRLPVGNIFSFLGYNVSLRQTMINDNTILYAISVKRSRLHWRTNTLQCECLRVCHVALVRLNWFISSLLLECSSLGINIVISVTPNWLYNVNVS